MRGERPPELPARGIRPSVRAMRVLRTILAGLLVIVAGLFTAVVVGLSALALWVRRRWLGGNPRPPVTRRRTSPHAAGQGDVIDIEATEIERTPKR